MKTLKEMHTRELLVVLNHARACGGKYDPTDNGGTECWTVEEIKAELTTREHIPNKREAKKIRQKKAKNKRNQ